MGAGGRLRLEPVRRPARRGPRRPGYRVWRELQANAAAFAALEDAAALEVRPTRLRLHDILLWLATTLRLTHAVQLGRATSEWTARAAVSR